MKNAFSAIRDKKLQLSIFVASAMLSGLAAAQDSGIDLEAVTDALEAAETSAHSVGSVVIGVVAGLAVIAIIIGLVRKL